MDGPLNSNAILEKIQELFDSGKWWIYKGKNVRQFEERFAHAHGSKYGVSTCNGTVPLEIVLRALGIGNGDKVILPAYDFYSLPKSVVNTGAIPIFADIESKTPTMSPSQVASLLSPEVKAVVVAHISGAVAQIDAIAEICEKAEVHLIEDCAQAAGAVYDGRRVGNWGTAAVFSFGGVKLMTCGQGGMITTSDSLLYEKCYAVVNRGMVPDGSVNRHGIIGDNFQMSELAAVTLGPQLDMLERRCREREEIMVYLDERISSTEGFVPVHQFTKTRIRAQMNYGFYCTPSYITRDALVECAHDLGIPISAGHYSVTSDDRLQGVFASIGLYPNAAKAEKELACIHHTDILKGKAYWEEKIEKLCDRFSIG